MTKIFNPPPGWPMPPGDWQPPPGWTPDPRWPAAPHGWDFWIDPDAGVGEDPDEAKTRVFISYRRSDTQSHANGISDGLATRLPDASIFMDLDSIPAGVDFEEHIRDEINRCDIVLVIIGDNWLETDPHTGGRRIDHPDDFVRLEIESALASPDVVVIPVLVEGARMPSSTELPDSIRRLARINALHIDDTRWRSDLSRLVARIAEIDSAKARVAPAKPGPEPLPPTENPPPQAPAPSAPSAPIPSYPAPDYQPYATVRSGGQAAFTTVPTSADSASVHGRRMSPAEVLVSILMVVLPVATFTLLAWVTPLIAAARRVGKGRTRRALRLAAAALAVTMIVAFTLIGNAPTGADGVAGGWQMWVGMLALLSCMVAGTWIGISFWRPRPDANRLR